MKRGFTLLELVVVIIIIGILATLGIAQYGRMVERARGAEARMILGVIRTQAAACYLEYNTVASFVAATAGIGTAADQIPSVCRASHYFSYNMVTGGVETVTTTATRCGAAGKGGNSAAAGRTLTLATTFPAATDVWGGNGGY